MEADRKRGEERSSAGAVDCFYDRVIDQQLYRPTSRNREQDRLNPLARKWVRKEDLHWEIT
jgi:hypothetical protein